MAASKSCSNRSGPRAGAPLRATQDRSLLLLYFWIEVREGDLERGKS